ncbi:MAG: hypothetical protein PHG65_07350, partial [Kiritimatiellae bacterium]|nr:hypothetical protein [Kiritimatiellia bacterium]
MSRRNNNRDGIALVIVLGIISIMVIMAVSFITLMRTERVSAKNFTDVVRGREMARGMLDQVLIDLYDLNWSVGTNLHIVPWTNNVFDLTAESSDLNFLDSKNGGTYFIYDDPTLPAAISGQWSEITFTNQETDAGCLYNFLAVNDSGRLDINHINTNLDLKRLNYSDPDIATINKIIKDRVRLYGNAEINARFGPPSSNKFSNILKNFTSYSRYTQKYIDPTTPANPVYVTNRVQIGGWVSGLQSNKAEIVSALTNSGVDVADTDFVFNNILDYVDDDSSNRNGGANGYCSEMLPMISEVAFAVSVTYDGTDTYTVNLSFTNEIWNPFEGTIPSGKYSVDWRGFTAVPNSLGFALTNTVGTNLPSLHTNEMTSSYVQYVGHYTVPPLTALPADLGDVTFTIQPVIQDDNGDVDVIPPRSFKRLLTTPTLSSREAYEIDDPRLNHLPGKWTLVSTPTIEHMSTNFTGAGEI